MESYLLGSVLKVKTNPYLHSKLKLTFLGQKDSENGEKKSVRYTQNHLHPFPNLTSKQLLALE